jgi:peptidoglycan hydrolase CwlO-like protein
MISVFFAILSSLVAILSALYARWSAKEARRANDIGRLNTLLSFQNQYLELMQQQAKIAAVLENSNSGMQAVKNKHAELDSKLREINSELEHYHSKIVKNKI